MIRGDEPIVTPEMIAAAAALRSDQSVDCVNRARRIARREEYTDFNTVKVVKNLRNDAIYFARAPIPAVGFHEAAPSAPVCKQVCVIPFRLQRLLDHGAPDLHEFVGAGLICQFDARRGLEPDELLRFYRRPERRAILKDFAGIEEDASAVRRRTESVLRELVGKN